MADRTALPLRVLRASLRAASRASAGVVEKVLKNGIASSPAEVPDARRKVDPRAPVTVRFGDRAVAAEHGATILETANLHGIDLRSYCGGNCSCGTCRVEIRTGARGLSPRQSMEEFVLGMEAALRGDRLACQAQILGPVDIFVPEWF
jgi:ferredoxin